MKTMNENFAWKILISDGSILAKCYFVPINFLITDSKTFIKSFNNTLSFAKKQKNIAHLGGNLETYRMGCLSVCLCRQVLCIFKSDRVNHCFFRGTAPRARQTQTARGSPPERRMYLTEGSPTSARMCVQHPRRNARCCKL
jgi:hypothetical protein